MAAKNLVFISIDDFAANLPAPALMPNLAALMARGTTFENAFTPSPLCTPARTAILTGLRPSTTGVVNNDVRDWYAQVDLERTLPATLMDAGYLSIGAGKLFDSLPGGVRGTQFDAFKDAPDPTRGSGGDVKPYTGTVPLGDAANMTWAIDRVLRAGAAGDRPFFLGFGFHDPHSPATPLPELLDLYDPDGITPPGVPGDLDDVPAYAIRELGNSRLIEGFRARGVTEELIAGYLAELSHVDRQIGRLTAALDRAGLADDTAIVLWSDHGFHFGDKEHWGKATLWDQSNRAPLVIVDPGRPGGRTVDTVVSTIDLFRTARDLLGLAPLDGIEGRSLVPLLDDPDRPWGEFAFADLRGELTVRTDGWRFTRYRDGSTELYDHRTDPGELDNLSGDPAHAGIEAALGRRIDGYVAEHGLVLGYGPGRVFDGTDGADTLLGGLQPDELRGGLGDDLYVVDRPTDRVVERAGEGRDRAYFVPVGIALTLPDGVEEGVLRLGSTLVGNALDNLLLASGGNDTVGGGDGDDEIGGWSGADNLSGGAGDDRLLGEGGNDTLRADAGDDRIEGGSGTDVLDASATLLGVRVDLAARAASGAEIGTDTLAGVEAAIGGEGSDRLAGDLGENRLAGRGGDDVLLGGGHAPRRGGQAGSGDTLDGGTGLDTVDYAGTPGGVRVDLALGTAAGSGDWTDRLVSIERVGGSGLGDGLLGGEGDDGFRGGGGGDLIEGRGGDDRLDGGAGADLFVFGAGDGADTVVGFEDGLDRLSFRGFGAAFDTPGEVLAAATAAADGSTRIDLVGPDGEAFGVLLPGFAPGLLDAADLGAVVA